MLHGWRQAGCRAAEPRHRDSVCRSSDRCDRALAWVFSADGQSAPFRSRPRSSCYSALRLSVRQQTTAERPEDFARPARIARSRLSTVANGAAALNRVQFGEVAAVGRSDGRAGSPQAIDYLSCRRGAGIRRPLRNEVDAFVFSQRSDLARIWTSFNRSTRQKPLRNLSIRYKQV